MRVGRVQADVIILAVTACETAKWYRDASLLLLRRDNLFPFAVYRVNGLGRAGIEAEAAAFEASRGIKLEGRGRQPRASWANRDTNGVLGATVGVTNEVISNEHHRLYTFKEALGKQFQHVHG